MQRTLSVLFSLLGLFLFVVGVLLLCPPLKEFYYSYLRGTEVVNPDRLGDWAVFAGSFLFASFVAFVASYMFDRHN
jgi:hypothetical protein